VAPEVLSENYDEKCDIWSCGVVLYVLISGDPPFTGKDTQEVLQKIHAGVIDFRYACWKRVSENVKDLLTNMLTKDTKIRYSAE
jgi:calcium-dependent protein kinase